MRSDAPDRPDILLIVSDDHGYADRSARGSTDARTPHLDRLAREGTVFDQGYVTAPICSPSRAGLIAGAHQQRWGARWFDTSAFPPPHQPVIPEVLQQAGYRTGYFGKVHYGPERPGDRACPENHGFDESLYGLAGLSMGRLHYLHHSRAAAEEYGEAAPAHGVDPLRENGREVECEQHLTVEFTDRALEFMGEGGEQDPYFCMVAYNAVHNFAWQLPQDELDARALPRHDDFDPASTDYLDWYDGAISPRLEHGREYYLAQLEIMDREIGRLLDHLEAAGRRESTLVVYLTDNGGSTCNYGDNAPLAGTKYSLFEGGVRCRSSSPGPAPSRRAHAHRPWSPRWTAAHLRGGSRRGPRRPLCWTGAICARRGRPRHRPGRARPARPTAAVTGAALRHRLPVGGAHAPVETALGRREHRPP